MNTFCSEREFYASFFFKAGSWSTTFCGGELALLGSGGCTAQPASAVRMHHEAALSHYGCQGSSSHIEQVFWLSKMESQQDPVFQQNRSSCRAS